MPGKRIGNMIACIILASLVFTGTALGDAGDAVLQEGIGSSLLDLASRLTDSLGEDAEQAEDTEQEDEGSLLADLVSRLIGNSDVQDEADEQDGRTVVITDAGTIHFEYDEDGLCTSAKDGEDEAIFAYTWDEQGRPIERYVVLYGEEYLYETYEYAATGYLEKLSVYDDPEVPIVWEYDQNGRAISSHNYSLNPPMSSVDMTYVWDEEGHLVSMTEYYHQDFAQIAAQSGANMDAAAIDALDERLESYVQEHDVLWYSDTELVMQTYTYTWTYDEQDRVTEYTVDQYSGSLYNYTTMGQKDLERNLVDTMIFDYSDPQMIRFTNVRSNLVNGEVQSEQEFGPMELEVHFNEAGLPIAVNDVDFDAYENLNCEVTDAQIGYFGYNWNETFCNYLGELHSGPAGLLYNQNYIQTGAALQIRIEGINSDGASVVYLAQPDPFGRQKCLKFTDGCYTMPASDQMDPERRNILIIDEDVDVFRYAVIEE